MSRAGLTGGMGARGRPCRGLAGLFAAALLVALTACGGRAIREEGDALRHQQLAPLPSPAYVAVGDPGPYHAALRLTDGALAKLVERALLGELADGPVSLGELPGLTPYFAAERTTVEVLEGCPGCLAIELRMGLTFKVEQDASARVKDVLTWISESGETRGILRLQGRLSLRSLEAGGAAISIGDLRLEEAKLLGSVEKGWINPRRTLERYLKEYVDETLEGPNIAASLPLPGALVLGEDTLPIERLGLISISARGGHPGEILIGATTTLPAPGDLSPHRKGGALGADLTSGEFAVVLGEGLLRGVLEREIARHPGSIPGDPYVGTLTAFALTPEGIAASVQLHQIGRRPWVAALETSGQVQVDGGRVTLPHTLSPAEAWTVEGWSRAARRDPHLAALAHSPYAHIAVLAPSALSWSEAGGARGGVLLSRAALAKGQLSLIGGF